MPRSAQLRRDKASELRARNLCKWAFANTCRTKFRWQFHAAKSRTVVAAIISNFCTDGDETRLMLWAVASFMKCLAHWRLQPAHRRAEPSLKGNRRRAIVWLPWPKLAGWRLAGTCNLDLRGWKADASKSMLEEGSEAVIGRTAPATSRQV